MSKERELLNKILATGWLNNTISCEVIELLDQPEQEPVAWMWTRNYEGGGYTNMVFQMKCKADEYAKDSENLKYPDLVRPLYLDENQGENNDR